MPFCLNKHCLSLYTFCCSSYKTPRNGCLGGNYAVAYNGVRDAGGITFEDFYPYHIINDISPVCDLTKNDYTVTIKSWLTIQRNEQAMIDYVLTKGPLTAVVDATNWGFYVNGTFSGCSPKLKINHGVQIVGVDVVEGYWLIRNSWGSDWGEGGYMKLALVRPKAE